MVSGEFFFLWHQRLGHIGEKGLKILHGNGMVEGMSSFSLYFDFFEHCVYRKKNQASFPCGVVEAPKIGSTTRGIPTRSGPWLAAPFSFGVVGPTVDNATSFPIFVCVFEI